MNRNTSTFVVLLIFSSILIACSFPLVWAADKGSWTTLERMPTARAGVGVAVVDGKIYAIGRGDGVNEMYDPETDSWTTKNPMTTSRSDFGIAVVDNKIYCIGGVDGSTTSGVNEAYNPETDTWENRTSMPTPRSQMDANEVDGKIYLISGRTGGPSSTVDLNEVYDPKTDTWTTKAPIPFPVTSYASAVVDNKIYIIGGQDEYHDPINLNFTQIYDATTDTWSQGAQSPDSVWQAAAGATSGELAPKRIYVVGGEGGFVTPLDHNYIYDPEADSWTVGQPITLPRINPGVAVVNDQIYVLGGLVVPWSVTGSMERYTPIGYIPEFPSRIIMPLLVTATVVAIVFKKKLAKTSR
jgi:N-acetylneuraminic acid mutarotase